MLFSRASLCLSPLLILMLCDISLAGESEKICLVRAGQPLAEIIIPNAASKQLKDAANTLSRYINKSTGATVPVSERVSDDKKIHISIGKTEYAKKNIAEDKILDADGFEILFPDKNNMVIYGGSDYGTEFGVYEFIEKHLGVKWLFPGELGEYVPKKQTIELPTVKISQEPAFKSRMLSGLPGKESEKYKIWARYLKMRAWADERLYGSHNIGKIIIPPEKYMKSNPEFFPIQKGKRFFPSPEAYKNSKYPSEWPIMGWQPCFSEEKTIDEGVKNICEYFKKYPDKGYCSLGVNDSGGHCECEKCKAKLGGRKNFLGQNNYSDLYYNWVNKIAEGVLKQYPDKIFGLIAYSEVAEPPSFKLNSHVIPAMTYERLKWAAPEIRKTGEKLTKDWAEKAQTLAWYDYIYGSPYKIPRVWFHLMSDYYRFGYSQNVRYLYAEAYPHEDWREGPKLYVALKLQWNPLQNVDDLLNDWYVSAVGKKAAPYISQYYKFWEDYWTTRVHQTKWFKDCTQGEGAQYLAFYEDGYLKALNREDFNTCEELLRKTVANAETPEEKARAEYFLKTYYAWSAPLIAGVEECEQNRRYIQLSDFQDKHLGLALDNFSKFMKTFPQNSSSDAFALMTGLLYEKTGKNGEWGKAFEKSCWSKTQYGWFKAFCNSITNEALKKEGISVNKASGTPEINGKPDGDFWLKSTKVTDFRSYLDNGMVSQPTMVSCAYDKDNLYIAYVCFENRMDELKSEEKTHNGKVWNDDCVELFIAPAGSNKEFYQIVVNPEGTTFEMHGMAGHTWNPEYKVKTFKGDTFWCAEVALPLKEFGIRDISNNLPVKINFNRQRPQTANRNKEISGWQFTDGNNQNPERFGNITMKMPGSER